MVMAVKTYKEMLFKQNGQDVTIKVGDVTPEGLVLAAMYDDPLTGERHIVVTTQEHLDDYATWYKGKEMIEAFNKKGEYNGHDIKKLGWFDYADGYNKIRDDASGQAVNILNMMCENQKEIGGFNPTADNKYVCVLGSAFNSTSIDWQFFNLNARGYSKTKQVIGIIRPVKDMPATEALAKQINFMPRQRTLNAA